MNKRQTHKHTSLAYIANMVEQGKQCRHLRKKIKHYQHAIPSHHFD